MSTSSLRKVPRPKLAAPAASLTFALLALRAGVANLAPPAAAFTPGQALPLVLDTIRGARSTLLVAACSFTSLSVASALREAPRHAVKDFVVVHTGEARRSRPGTAQCGGDCGTKAPTCRPRTDP